MGAEQSAACAALEQTRTLSMERFAVMSSKQGVKGSACMCPNGWQGFFTDAHSDGAAAGLAGSTSVGAAAMQQQQRSPPGRKSGSRGGLDPASANDANACLQRHLQNKHILLRMWVMFCVNTLSRVQIAQVSEGRWWALPADL